MATERMVSMADLLIQAKITNRLLAAQLRDKMKQNELIQLLDSTGANDREIADVLGTTPGTVNNAKVRMKKKVVAKED
jgi:DNA-binding CsgD family transcriptional regulator